MQDILLFPSIMHEDIDFSYSTKFRAESLDSNGKESPRLKTPVENMFSPEIPHKNQFPNQNPRKIQFMRNLAPIERPETSINENIVRKTENTTKKEETDKILKKTGQNINFNNISIPSQLESFKNEITIKFEQISLKLHTLDSKLLSSESKTSKLEEKFLKFENLHIIDQISKLEESFNYKYMKIKEYFSKFGDQFKTHLRLYDKKRKESDKALQTLDNYTKSLPNTLENKLMDGLRAKFEVFEAEKHEEFKNMFDKLKNLKEEVNIHSIVHSEFQGMFALQTMAQNDYKSEFLTFSKDIIGKIDLQMVFQRELENEMKIMNETQGELFQGVRKHDLELDNLNKILQNLSSNYNIFKKVQEKETVIKSQLIDLLGDINYLKSKMNGDGEIEKSLKKGQMEEIYKLIDKKFDIMKENNKTD